MPLIKSGRYSCSAFGGAIRSRSSPKFGASRGGAAVVETLSLDAASRCAGKSMCNTALLVPSTTGKKSCLNPGQNQYFH